MTAKKSIPQKFEFNKDGWPLNPLTGQPYTRDEIVTDETIPYPHHVDPANPGRYWQRRTPAQLAAEKNRAAQKAKRRSVRSRRTLRTTVPFSLSGAEIQTRRRNAATVELVERANKPDELEPPANQLSFIVQDGPHYDPATGEWVITVDGDPAAWAETEAQAKRSYDELTDTSAILFTACGRLSILEV